MGEQRKRSSKIIPGRSALVGGATVRRVLPQPRLRTIGSWCFADHFGSIMVGPDHGLDVGPHPHLGLQTVTWLTQGTLLHRDSLGTEQLLRAGELNLMTAGQGVAHAEEAAGTSGGPLEGIQLWLAQPEATRNGPAAFSHHVDLPMIDLGGGFGTLLIGTFDGQVSPALVATPTLGLEVTVRPRVDLALDPSFEHALIVLEGVVEFDGQRLHPGHLGVLMPGRQGVALESTDGGRAMLLGGAPFGERLEMWWNFVARDKGEVVAAYASWVHDDGRFGTVDSHLPRVLTTPPSGRAGR